MSGANTQVPGDSRCGSHTGPQRGHSLGSCDPGFREYNHIRVFKVKLSEGQGPFQTRLGVSRVVWPWTRELFKGDSSSHRRKELSPVCGMAAQSPGHPSVEPPPVPEPGTHGAAEGCWDLGTLCSCPNTKLSGTQS